MDQVLWMKYVVHICQNKKQHLQDTLRQPASVLKTSSANWWDEVGGGVQQGKEVLSLEQFEQLNIQCRIFIMLIPP